MKYVSPDEALLDAVISGCLIKRLAVSREVQSERQRGVAVVSRQPGLDDLPGRWRLGWQGGAADCGGQRAETPDCRHQMAVEPTRNHGKAAGREPPANGAAAHPDRGGEGHTSPGVDHRRKADVVDRQEPAGFLGGAKSASS